MRCTILLTVGFPKTPILGRISPSMKQSHWCSRSQAICQLYHRKLPMISVHKQIHIHTNSYLTYVIKLICIFSEIQDNTSCILISSNVEQFVVSHQHIKSYLSSHVKQNKTEVMQDKNKLLVKAYFLHVNALYVLNEDALNGNGTFACVCVHICHIL